MKNNDILASVAALKVLEEWNVKDVYGYPGGSISSLMNALEIEKERINYIQIRHEQVGALAASAHAKLTGKIGVTFGSAGPGAVNLLNGLYDAKADHAPVLAIVGQVGSTNMNYDYFQEMPETPIFNDVSCYDRVVMNPESLPHVFDEAIKAAYKNKGVAVVVVPNNFGFIKIPDKKYSSYNSYEDKPEPKPVATNEEVKTFLSMVKNAKRPVIHAGRGIKNHGEDLIKLSKKLQIPIVIDGLAIGLISNDYRGFLGTANRAASKPANEFIETADLIIAIGGDFSFAKTLYDQSNFKYVQIDNDKSQLGRHHTLDFGIWSDAGSFIDKALDLSVPVDASPFFKAAEADMDNWKKYINFIQSSSSDEILPSPIYKQINTIADNNAIYSIDVGDNIINAFRNLKLTNKNKWVISALFATMGSGLPGAIAAKRDYPDRQVWNITGDGAQAMVIQDLATLVKYKMPVINIVTSNRDLGFIEGEQEDEPMKFFGLDLQSIDYATVAKGFGVDSATVNKFSELKLALKEAVKVTTNGKPFLIDIKIAQKRALPVEDIKTCIKNNKIIQKIVPNYRIDKPNYKQYSVREFLNEYGGNKLQPLDEFFKKFNVEI